MLNGVSTGRVARNLNRVKRWKGSGEEPTSADFGIGHDIGERLWSLVHYKHPVEKSLCKGRIVAGTDGQDAVPLDAARPRTTAYTETRRVFACSADCHTFIRCALSVITWCMPKLRL